jgi:DNA-binding beta-propeller fold protein YncE/mono/diheme cytochrome c family protein
MRMISTVSLALALVATLTLETRGASPAPRAITFTSVTITPVAASRTVGSVITFVVNASANNGSLSYQMNFGDAPGLSASQASNTFTHTYSAPGHYFLTVELTESAPGNSTQTVSNIPLTIINPIAAPKPTNSSTIILDQARNRIWVVNPDQDTVSTFLTTGLPSPTVNELKVGKNPRTLAQAADGTIWVVSQTHPSISVFEPTSPFALLHVIPLPHGSAPYGIAMTPDGTAAYVSFQGSGGTRKISTSTRGTLAETTLPPSARGVSVASDGNVYVTRFISPQPDPIQLFSLPAFTSGNHGEVYKFNSSLGHLLTFNLPIDLGLADPDPDFGPGGGPSANTSRGVPNYLTSMVITPDSRSAWVPCKKDNIQRGTGPLRDGKTPGFEVTYRAIITSLNLVNNTAPVGFSDRIDINDNEMPQAACTSPLGDYLFVALQGTNRIQVRDLTKMGGTGVSPVLGGTPLNALGNVTGTNATNGLAPQGVVIDPNTNRLFIQNYMGRTVGVIDTSIVYTNHGVGGFVLPAPLAVVRTVGTSDADDQLPTAVLLGKRVFYNAGDTRMSGNGYVSCAGCHLDGGSDMRVWDFTNRTEGFRNTVMLQGRGGTAQGFVHWSANFDEIQDFENDIRNAFGGTGFLTDPQFVSSTNPYTDTRKASFANPELDGLAAYVASLDKVARSPFRNADGSLTASGAAGEAVFREQACQNCHGGRQFTNSTVPGVSLPNPSPASILFNVGTIKSTSGQRLGAALPGIDTPTLKGVWQTAPYFHDGSAATIPAVITTVPNTTPTAHGSMHTLSAQKQADLARYMIEIDEIDAPPSPDGQVDDVFLGAVASGRPYSLADAANGRLPYVDRSYTITSFPGVAAGGILVRTAEDDKDSTSASQVSFTVSAGANVYVFYDSRRTSLPTFLNGLSPIGGQNMTISPGLVMNCFQLTNVPPAGGVVTLGGNQQGGPTGALRNYIVVVVDAGALFSEGPISRGEWVHDQDADGDGLRDEFEATNAATVANLSPWDFDSATAALADEDHLDGTGTQTLFKAQPPLSTGGFAGGGGGGGGCGLGGFEFLFPMLALRLMRRRRK